MASVMKVEFYDMFQCIADQCSFTCCQGWDISVDHDTYNKWKNNDQETGYLCNKIKVVHSKKKPNYFIKMGAGKTCPFLNEKGLCNIVIQHGDEYLSNTCKTFPRLENSYDGIKELSLSCACPVVVDMLQNLNRAVKIMNPDESNPLDNLPVDIRIRDRMISLMQEENYSIKDRILLIFHLLLNRKEEQRLKSIHFSEDQFDNGLTNNINIWSGIKVEPEDTLSEANELFLDIIQNYRKEKQYRGYLQELYDTAKELDVEQCLPKWKDFQRIFGKYDKLIENCLVLKIFANCISEDPDDILIAFQVLITEYIMIRYSSFLKWLTKQLTFQDIKNNIVIYSRIIGYNAEGIKEFWEESFDEAVWDFGYMLLLVS